MNTQIIRLLSLLAAFICAANTSPCQAQDRFSLSPDGTEVIDAKTGLVWRRCSEGQNWSGGVCTGSASLLTLPQAFTLAKAQPGWRVPNAKELSSLVDRNYLSPAIDTAIFPQTLSNWYWTSTPYLREPPNHQAVYFDRGYITPGAIIVPGVGGHSNNWFGYLRLVR